MEELDARFHSQTKDHSMKICIRWQKRWVRSTVSSRDRLNTTWWYTWVLSMSWSWQRGSSSCRSKSWPYIVFCGWRSAQHALRIHKQKNGRQCSVISNVNDRQCLCRIVQQYGVFIYRWPELFLSETKANDSDRALKGSLIRQNRC